MNAGRRPTGAAARPHKSCAAVDGILGQLPAAIEQAHERIIGERPVAGADKLLSLYEGSHHVLVRGKAGAEVEFGNPRLLAENLDGIIVTRHHREDGLLAAQRRRAPTEAARRHPQKQLPERPTPGRVATGGGPPPWTGQCSRTTCESSPGSRGPKQSPTPPPTRPKCEPPQSAASRQTSNVPKAFPLASSRTETAAATIAAPEAHIPQSLRDEKPKPTPTKTPSAPASPWLIFKSPVWRTDSREPLI